MSFDRWRIIGALLVAALVAACSTLRLSYNQGPTLAYWWIDGYVDVSDMQRPLVREGIERWFRWHRAHELPAYVELIERAQARVQQPLAAGELCALWDAVRERAETALEQAVPEMAALARRLSPQQLRNMERKFAKSNKSFRADFLQAERAERHRAAVKRVRDRFELVYGNLDRSQRELLAHRVAMSPFDAELLDAERRARQHDILQTLRLLHGAAPTASQAETTLRALAGRLLHTPRAAYRSYQERLTAYNCAMVADLHDAMTPAQREHARAKFAGWADDLRALGAADPR